MVASEVNDYEHLLEVRDLQVEFLTRKGTVQAVRGVSFHIDHGETLGVVGESGSGKSVTGLAILGLIRIPGRVIGGEVLWKGLPIVAVGDDAGVRPLRGKQISMIFQDPMTSLDPLFPVGKQITEVLKRHLGMDRRRARDRATELLDMVGISSPRQRLSQYPHEFSGGMRQRAMIAMALACQPELLIADEPTTALDVTIQAQILELLQELQDELNLAVMFITHDLGVISGLCDRIQVMYGGKLAETGPVDDVLRVPGHPYTAGLLRSTPDMETVRGQLVAIEGSPPNALHPPSACPFHPRCPVAEQKCQEEYPPAKRLGDTRQAACWHAFDESVTRVGVRS